MTNQSCIIGSLIQCQAFSKRLSKWKVMFFHSFSISVLQQTFLEDTLAMRIMYYAIFKMDNHQGPTI